MPSAYDARIRQLDLPEQDSLKNAAERCSADTGMLQSIGRALGQQVRITRSDDPRFFAVYTVARANPGGDPDDVVRTGLTGRERLGTPNEMAAVVQANVVDVAPSASGARFFEGAKEDERLPYLIAIAPHGGDIEEHTDAQAQQLASELAANGYPASSWICKGFGDELEGAFNRWHITSTDLHLASFPLLSAVATRRFCYGVAFHGFGKRPGEADLYIGGGASLALKRAIRRALGRANLPLEIKIATENDDPKFQGDSVENLINRLAAQAIHIEQSSEARKFSEQIAQLIATVYRSPTRRLLRAWADFLR